MSVPSAGPDPDERSPVPGLAPSNGATAGPWVPPGAPATGEPTGSSAPPAPEGRPRSPWAEVRRDWRPLVVLLVGLAVLGVPLGVLWWGLAPRAGFSITVDGPVVIGQPSEELLAGDDTIFCLIFAAVGLLAGTGGWLMRRRRGLGVLAGLALGMAASAAVAWQIGGLLAPQPSHAALTHVGGRVSTPLELGALPALGVGVFFAVLVYVVAALYTRSDDLGRAEPAPRLPVPAAASGGSGVAGRSGGEAPGDSGSGGTGLPS